MKKGMKYLFTFLSIFLLGMTSFSIGYSAWARTVSFETQIENAGEKQKVAYILDQENIYYDSIEKAVVAANNQDSEEDPKTVIVIPGNVETIYEINSSFSIDKYVTVTLPCNLEDHTKFEEEVNDYPVEDGVADLTAGDFYGYAGFADTKPEEFRKIQVEVSNEVKIEVNGTLNVGGQHGGTNPQSATKGNYAEIIMKGNSSITFNSGSVLNCFGFIKKSPIDSNVNGEVITKVPQINILSGGIINTLLTIYDWPSGSGALSAYTNSVFPIDEFDFPNISVNSKYFYGSKLNATFHVWGSSMGHVSTDSVAISNDDSLIILDDTNSIVDINFNNKTGNATLSPYISDHNTEINCYVSAILSSVSVIIAYNIPILGTQKITINSSKYFLPIPNSFNINAYGQFQSLYKVKLMSGSKLHVHEGANGIIQDTCIAYSGSSIINDGILTFNKNFGGIISVSPDTEAGVASIITSSNFGSITTSDLGNEPEASDPPEPIVYFNSSAAHTMVKNVTYHSDGKGYWTTSTQTIGGVTLSANSTDIPYSQNQSVTLTVSAIILPANSSFVLNIYQKIGDGSYSMLPPENKKSSENCSYKGTFTVDLNQVQTDTKNTFYVEIIHSGNNLKLESNKVEVLQRGVGSITDFSISPDKTSFDNSTTVKLTVSAKFNPVGSTIVFHVGTSSGKYSQEKTVKDEENSGIVSTTFSFDISATTTFYAIAEIDGKNVSSVEKSVKVTKNSCLLGTTDVLLSSGETKQAKDLTKDDKILTFDHTQGKFVERNSIFVATKEKNNYEIITLFFDNGSVLEVGNGHGLFNKNRNTYEIYYGEEFYNHIGETFIAVDYNFGKPLLEETKLIDVQIEERNTVLYTPLSEYDVNVVADGMLTIPDDIEGMFDSFTYNDDLTFDLEALQNDIDTYGVYTYEDVKDVVHPYVFEVFNFKYWKAFIGKGTLTYDKVNHWINTYMDQIVAFNNLDWDTSKQVPLGPEHG